MTEFSYGIERLLNTPSLVQSLRTHRVGLVAHPASLTQDMTHTLDALIAVGITPLRVFGPQHGVRGDKQDNMVESPDFIDPVHQIPVISLYGHHRRPTKEMIEDLDIIIFDLQDLGCRIYTYISTLHYFLEAAGPTGTAIWVLDRPNPAGRGVDGLRLEPGEESFVGVASIPCRYGLTIGELAGWFNDQLSQPAALSVIEMTHYDPTTAPDYGWPSRLAWVNPSPNASSLNMARLFSGTVLLEGTLLSEGRGTTTPLEVVGSPEFPAAHIKHRLEKNLGSELGGLRIRTCFFEPTFHKHQGQLCQGLQFHTGIPQFNAQDCHPYLIFAYVLKLLREAQPDTALWRNHEYEYELDRLPIDVINGGNGLRTWVDDDKQGLEQLRGRLDITRDEWIRGTSAYYRYP